MVSRSPSEKLQLYQDLCMATEKPDRLYLLSSEIMSHKVLLQFLVGVVDAQLLQVIDVETLEPVNI